MTGTKSSSCQGLRVPDFLQSLKLLAEAFAIVAVVAGLLALLFRPREHSPRTPRPPVSPMWNGWAISGGLVLFMFLPPVAMLMLESAGFYSFVYGADFPPMPPAGADLVPDQEYAMNLRNLWATIIAAPVFIGLFLFLMHETYRVRPHDIGLRFDQGRVDVSRGVRMWAWLTPITFVVFLIVNLVFWHLHGLEPKQHPLAKLGATDDRLTWTLVGLQVIVFGPIIEELLFRGLLLPWVTMRREHVVGCLLGCVMFAFLLTDRSPDKARPEWMLLVPTAFVIIVGPIGLMLSQKNAAIFATALLFAAFHSSVWPTPVPLFGLGLGLGWLAVRSGGLLAPMLVHGLFNAVSFGYLLLGGE